jgi:hypothetical protein
MKRGRVMGDLKKTLRQRQFSLHLFALLLMLVPAVWTYSAAKSGSDAAVWFLLAIVILGNILAMIVP